MESPSEPRRRRTVRFILTPNVKGLRIREGITPSATVDVTRNIFLRLHERPSTVPVTVTSLSHRDPGPHLHVHPSSPIWSCSSYLPSQKSPMAIRQGLGSFLCGVPMVGVYGCLRLSTVSTVVYGRCLRLSHGPWTLLSSVVTPVSSSSSLPPLHPYPGSERRRK